MATPDEVHLPTDDPLPRRRLSQNPFYVLGVTPQARPSAVEAEAEALLSSLASDPASRIYPTPIGPRCRDAALVRKALASVTNPDARILHEIWAVLAPTWSEPPRNIPNGYPHAMGVFGWRTRPPVPGAEEDGR